VAVQIEEQGNQIWLYELARETLTRLTFDAVQNETPLWMADGKRVVFYSNKEGPLNLFWQMADGSGGFERLTTSTNPHAPVSVSPDGALLAFTEAPGASRDIWVLRLSDRQAQPFLQTPAIEGGAQFSPDGRWMAYVSDESGRPEIYVQPYPGPGGKWQVSTERGQEPVWNRNGQELFYRSGNKMMAVDIATSPSFSAGRPKVLFDRPYVAIQLPQTIPVYDVSADGQRFLMLKEGERPEAPPIEVVVNWPEDLRRRIPTGTR
jgi:Tol biopolymer transport system component